MTPNYGSIAGIMPSLLMLTNTSINVFTPVDHHIRSTFTNPGTTANNNPKYIAYGYDIITNLTLNHEDSRIILNRGLTVSPNGLGLTTRSKGGSKFGDTIDSKVVIKQLTASRKYKPMGVFVTFIYNQAKHFDV